MRLCSRGPGPLWNYILGMCLVVVLAGLIYSGADVPARTFGARDFRPPSSRSANAGKRLAIAYAALPLAFEPNRGQTDRSVLYFARGGGYGLFLTPRGAVFTLDASAIAGDPSSARLLSRRGKLSTPASPAVLRMNLLAAAPHPRVSAAGMLPGVTNYIRGNDPARWRMNVRHYARVRYAQVYSGIDLTFHGESRQLEFDFVVAPSANPSPVRFRFSGAQSVALDSAGQLIVASAAGDLRLHRPLAYQERHGTRHAIAASFVLRRGGEVGFVIGPYDHRRALVIDPALSYSTFLGGAGEDEATAIAVDSAGNAYVTGQTASSNFPSSSGTVGTRGNLDVFVSSLRPDGSALNYTTLLGGSGNEIGNAIAVDPAGDAYVTGATNSSDFPVTSGALRLSPGGAQDAFVARLDPTGAVSYATYLGGSDDDSGNGIAVDASGNAYVAGDTLSTDFPGASASQLQSGNAGSDDGFVAKLNAAGSALGFAAYLGGSQADSANAIALDSSGNIYITGSTLSADFPHTPGAYQARCGGDANCNGGLADAFLSKIKGDGSAFLYSTFLGGSGSDIANGVAVDAAGEATIVGSTSSSDFPTANPFQAALEGAPDIFVTRLNAAGTGLIFSTYIGCDDPDEATAVALDPIGDVYLTGRTQSATDFPTTGGFQVSIGGGADAFVTELSGSGQMIYSSYLGGSGNENSFQGSISQAPLGGIAVDSAGNAYLAGSTNSTTGFTTVSPFQATNAGGASDAFVAKIAAVSSDFSLSASPATLMVSAGSSANAAVTVNSVNNPFAGSVALSCSGLPAAAGCTFTPPSGTPGAGGFGSTLTLATTPAISAGDYPISVSGTSGAVNESTTINLSVQDFQISASAPAAPTVNAGSLTTATVTIVPLNGFAGAVALSCASDLPAGTTCSFNPSTVTNGAGTSTLTLNTTSSAATGAASINVVGTFQATVHSAAIALTIDPPPGFTVSASAISPSSVVPGGRASSTITVTPISGFSSDVALSCTITPSGYKMPTCSLTSRMIRGAAGTSTLTVSTVANSSAAQPWSHHLGFMYALLLPLGGLALFGTGGRRRGKTRAGLFFVLTLTVLSGLLLLPACGRGPSQTPAGTYTIAVTGSAGTSAPHNASLTLTVQ